jgi:hypothetical protein
MKPMYDTWRRRSSLPEPIRQSQIGCGSGRIQLAAAASAGSSQNRSPAPLETCDSPVSTRFRDTRLAQQKHGQLARVPRWPENNTRRPPCVRTRGSGAKSQKQNGFLRSGARPWGALDLSALPRASGLGLVQGRGTFRGFQALPNATIGPKPLNVLPVHHKGKPLSFCFSPSFSSFANAAPSKRPPSRLCFSAHAVPGAPPLASPRTYRTPPRYGLTFPPSLRKLGGIGGVPAQPRAAAGTVRSPFGL